MPNDINTASDYAALRSVLDLAYEQSSSGKGKNRHANGKPFLSQPIMEIGRMVGIGYQLGQAMKKAQEAGGMASRGNVAAAQAELLGAINYLAAAHIQLGEIEAAKAEPDLPDIDRTIFPHRVNSVPDNKPICSSCGRNRDKAPAATCTAAHLHHF